MATDKKSISTKDFTLTTEWIYYLGFLFTLALLYIYLTHRTDNIVREIESTKRDLVELRAENITLKSDIMKNYYASITKETIVRIIIIDPDEL